MHFAFQINVASRMRACDRLIVRMMTKMLSMKVLFQIVMTAKELQACLCWQFFTIEAENTLSELAFDWNDVRKTRRLKDEWRRQISFELDIRKEEFLTTKMTTFLQAAKNCQDVDDFHSSFALFFRRWSDEDEERVNDSDAFNKDVSFCVYRLLSNNQQFFQLLLNINHRLLSFVSDFNLFQERFLELLFLIAMSAIDFLILLVYERALDADDESFLVLKDFLQ